MKLNFNQLSTFLAVAESQSLSKAAEKLCLSLSAVSMQVKHLEERLDVLLFRRTSRGIVLTVEGEELVQSTRKAMDEIDGALHKIKRTVDTQSGRLAIACIPAIAGICLPQILKEFTHQAPKATIRVMELQQSELLRAVRQNDVDFAIGIDAGRQIDFVSKPIFEEEYVALLPESVAAEYPLGINLRELADFQIISFNQNHSQRIIEAALDSENIAPKFALECTHLTTIIQMVSAGLGVAVIPRIAAKEAKSNGVVRILHPRLTRIISIISNREQILSTTSTAFVQLCLQRMPGLAEQGPFEDMQT